MGSSRRKEGTKIMKLPRITIGKNITGGISLVAIFSFIQASGASEDMKLAAGFGVVVLFVGLAVAAQYGPPPK